MRVDLTPDHAAPAPAAPAPRVPEPLVRNQPAPPLGWRRPLLFALLVLACGAALGAAGFAAEQYYFVWDPRVDATSVGWRVAGGAGLRPVAPVIAGGRLVWGQGPYTCVLDLESGDAHVVGVAPRRTSVWPPAAGPRYVAWVEAPRDAGQGRRARLWVYDAQRGRRQSFAVGPGATTAAVAGDVVAWFDGGAPSRVMCLDMRTGRRSMLAEGAGIDYPVLGGDGVIGWLDRGTGGAPSLVVRDLARGTSASIPLAAAGSGVSVTDVRLGGRTLVWTLRDASATTVMSADIDAGSPTVVARGAVAATATDGDVVVWVAGDDSSGSPVVLAQRLSGGAEFEIGRPAAWPKALAVGDGQVAWLSDEGVRTFIETAGFRP